LRCIREDFYGKEKRDLRKKREEKKQKRKKGIFESGQKIYYQFAETGPRKV
jgi:hypothetical protein